MTSAEDIIKRLKLKLHPEGGHYREIFRDSKGLERAASPAIYYFS